LKKLLNERCLLMAAAFIGLNILDAWLTTKALALGGVELNPIMRLLGEDMLWKGILGGAVVAGLYLWHKQKLLLPLCIFMLAVVLWNSIMLISIMFY